MRISEVSSEQSAASDISNDQSCSPLQNLESLIVELEQMAPMISAETVQKLRNLITSFPSRLNEDQKVRLWALSYRIWNLCIEISNSLQPGQDVGEEHAKLRHIASDLLVVAGSNGSINSSLSKTAMFFFKTGTIWHKLENYPMAAACFEKATEFSKRAKDHQLATGISQVQKEEDEKFLFDLYVARAKTAWELQQKALVRSLLSRARGMLKLASSLSDSSVMYEELTKEYLHYGKVLLARQDKPSQAESIQFLEQAFEVCSDGVSTVAAARGDGANDEGLLGKIGRETLVLNNLKFEVLRYLAASHLQNDNFENVLKCVDILKIGPDHASTPFLALKAYVGLKRFEEAEKEAYILVAQRITPVDVCAAAIDVLIKGSCGSAVLNNINIMQDAVKKAFAIAHARFPSNKELIVRVLDTLLTQPSDQFFKRRVETALAIAVDEKVINSIIETSSVRKSAASIVNELEDESSTGTAHQCIYTLLWNSAIEFFRVKDYATCIQLFEASLLYLSPKDNSYTQYRAKNLHVLCICHLALEQYDRALEYVNEANKLEPSIAGVFLKYKIALQTNDEEGAAKQVDEMFQCPGFEADYLTLASHEAISCKCIGVAITALSRLLDLSCSSAKTNTGENKEAVLIRNIIALSSQDSNNLSTTSKYFKLARSRLTELGPEGFLGCGGMEEKEAQWYASSAWNYGLDTAKTEEWGSCTEFFQCAADFFGVLPDTLENLEMRRASMLLVVGSILVGSKNEAENNAGLKEASTYLEKCREIHEIVRSKGVSGANNHTVEIYLNLLSFEVKRRMKDHRAQLDIICHCSTLLGFQPKLFFSMASSGREGQDVEVSMAAYEACLSLALACPDPDYALVAATIRKMILLADTMRRDSPKAMSLYKQAHQILLGLGLGVYPKEEVQWLVSTAWNRASLHVKFNRYAIAEKWMNLALDMLQHAPSMENFRSVMLENLSFVLKAKADEFLLEE